MPLSTSRWRGKGSSFPAGTRKFLPFSDIEICGDGKTSRNSPGCMTGECRKVHKRVGIRGEKEKKENMN